MRWSVCNLCKLHAHRNHSRPIPPIPPIRQSINISTPVMAPGPPPGKPAANIENHWSVRCCNLNKFYLLEFPSSVLCKNVIRWCVQVCVPVQSINGTRSQGSADRTFSWRKAGPPVVGGCQAGLALNPARWSFVACKIFSLHCEKGLKNLKLVYLILCDVSRKH